MEVEYYFCCKIVADLFSDDLDRDQLQTPCVFATRRELIRIWTIGGEDILLVISIGIIVDIMMILLILMILRATGYPHFSIDPFLEISCTLLKGEKDIIRFKTVPTRAKK